MIGFISSLAFVPILLLKELTEQNQSHTIIPRRRQSLFQQITRAIKSCRRTPSVWMAGGLESTMYIATYAVRAFLPIYTLSEGVNVFVVGSFFQSKKLSITAHPWCGRFGDRFGYPSAIVLGLFSLSI